MTEHTSSNRRPDFHIPEDVRAHFRTAHDEMRKSVEGIFPPEFVSHRRAAKKEVLLAFRGMIDHAIARMDERMDEVSKKNE